MKSLVPLLAIHLCLLFVGVIILYTTASTHHSISFLVGGLMSAASIMMKGISFQAIVKKKLIALGVFLIVIKYSILGAIIFFLLREPWINLLAFLGGMSVLIVTSVAHAFLIKA